MLLAARQHVRPQARVLSQLSHAQAGARRPRARHRCSGGRQGRTQDRSRVRLSRRSRGGRAASSLKTHRLRHPPRELTLHHITHVAFAVSKRATQQPQLLLFLDVSVLVKGQRLYGDATRDEIGGVGVAPAVPARISGQEARQPTSLAQAQRTADHRNKGPRHAHAAAAASSRGTEGPGQPNGGTGQRLRTRRHRRAQSNRGGAGGSAGGSAGSSTTCASARSTAALGLMRFHTFVVVKAGGAAANPQAALVDSRQQHAAVQIAQVSHDRGFLLGRNAAGQHRARPAASQRAVVH